MPDNVPGLKWDDVPYVLAAVRLGSCAAAARTLGVAVTTVTRRIAAFEAAIGRPVVRLTRDGVSLTEAGAGLMDHMVRIEEAMVGLSRQLKSGDHPSGPVRVTTLETVATAFLAPNVGAFVEQHPDIELTLKGENRSADLLRGEADISVRLGRPRQKDLVVRRLGLVHFDLFASAGYIERWGRPDPEHLDGHRLVTFTRDFNHIFIVQWLSERSQGAQVVCRSVHTTTLLEMIRSGAGIGLLPTRMGEGLVPLNAQNLPGAPLWLAFHQDDRNRPAIRAVANWIIDTLTEVG
ncbi:MAG: LysR family transcriptional regulator [Bradymonadia bacterium]